MTNPIYYGIIVYRVKKKEKELDDANKTIRDLTKVIKMSQNEVKRYAKKMLKKYGYTPVLEDGFIYAEGKEPVMVLAHMDTVFGNSKGMTVFYKNGIMSSPQGLGADDRAGIYAVLELLKRGHRPTVLFLEDEEIGCVGASKFAVSDIIVPDIKFMIELDRQGKKDAVFYDCANYDFEDYIMDFGFKFAFGSFSDIAVIAPVVGVSAVNLSVGYYRQHTKFETLNINELLMTIGKVEKIINNLPEKPFTYIEKPKTYKYSKYGTYSYYSDDWDSTYYSDDVDKNYRRKYTKDIKGRTLVSCNYGYIILPDHNIIDLSYTDRYFMGEDDLIYLEDGTPVDFAEVVDGNWQPIYYEDFLF